MWVLTALILACPVAAEDALPELVHDVTVTEVFGALEGLAEEGRSAMELFALLGDGESRRVSGEIIKSVFDTYGIAMDHIPLDELQEVVAHDGVIDLVFDFGGDEHRVVNVPARTRWVLGKKGNPVEKRIGNNTFRISETIRMYTDGQTVSIRRGDLEAKWFIWWDLGMDTVHQPGKIHRDRKGRIVLRLSPNGQFEPKTSDDWLVVSAAAGSVEIGLDPIKSVN